MRAAALVLPLLLAACGEDAPTEAPAEGEVKVTEKGDQKAKPTKGPHAGEAPPKQDGPPPPTPLPADADPALTNPDLAKETAPGSFKCRFETSKGAFVVQVTREWAPNGADRFYNLCKIGFWNEAKFFRNIKGFMVQWGMSAYPESNKVWSEATIPDDPVVKSNEPLYVTFAKTGAPNSRSTQIFINHGNNANLDPMGFAPIGQVVEGKDVVGQLYDGYGEGAPRGRGPNQGIIAEYGDVYLSSEFPKLDKIVKTTVE
jgi:Peptidyl-prolyl cis-trans isomerase (rotamase) - cyclophilin family